MKAQASDVMIMLVGAVFAMALLTLVYFFVAGINPPFSGFEAAQRLLVQATKAKTNLCFGWEKIPFKKDEAISKDALIKSAALNIDDSRTEAISCDSDSCLVIQDTQISISAQCDTDANGNFDCKLFFGTKDCQ